MQGHTGVRGVVLSDGVSSFGGPRPEVRVGPVWVGVSFWCAETEYRCRRLTFEEGFRVTGRPTLYGGKSGCPVPILLEDGTDSCFRRKYFHIGVFLPPLTEDGESRLVRCGLTMRWEVGAARRSWDSVSGSRRRSTGANYFLFKI